MKVQVLVDREAAILSGSDRYGDVTVDLDPATLTPEGRAALASAPERNGVTLLHAMPSLGYGTLSPTTNVPRPKLGQPDPLAWLSWREQAQADVTEQAKQLIDQDRADVDAYIAWASEQPVDAFVTHRYATRDTWAVELPIRPTLATPSGRYWTDGPTAIRKALSETLAEAARIAEERSAIARDVIAKREAAREAAEQRRLSQLGEHVRTRMDANANARLACGLLPESEILNSIRDEAYRPLDKFPRYKKIRSSEIDHSGDCCGDRLDCQTDEPNGIGADLFDLFQEIGRAAPPEYRPRLAARLHTCECSECGASLSRLSVQVALAVGDLELTREYALDPADA